MALRATPKPLARRSLSALAADTGGNALAIMAAAIFPLAGLAGGAIDMSRLYLVKSRLQQACDAGVLAGRRVMTGNSVVADANAMTQAQNFFNINLAQGAYGATLGAFVVTDVREGGVPAGNLTGRVAGTATAEVPMTLMRIFGNESVEMTAKCEANLNIANNDIMFVLDLTGSMGCRPDASGPCGNPPTLVNGVWRSPEAADSRIAALRAAVSQFFTTLNNATPPTARLRVGFVPYSSSVNVAGVLPAGSLAATHDYRSRAAVFETPIQTAGASFGAWGADSWQKFGNDDATLTQAQCLQYMGNQNPYQTATVSGGPAPTPSTEIQMRSDGTATAGGTDGEWGWNGAPDTGGTNRSCRRRIRSRTNAVEQFGFTRFEYGVENYNVANATLAVADLNLGTLRSQVRTTTRGTWNEQELVAKQTAGTASGLTIINKTWTGDCVEERDDNDNIDLLATNDLTRWKPARRELVYYPNSDVNADVQPREADRNYTCTMPAQRLQVMTQAQVDAYVGNPRFAPIGSTYHDIGMIWGTRLMSTAGVFAADHTAAAPNGRPVRRHIIFMTDGEMAPSLNAYGTYGIESLDRRISPAGTNQAGLTTLHNQRYAAACAYARDEANISVWVVAFGETLTANMIECATPGQARQANNAPELQSMFQEIAQKIAELRLSE